MQPATPRGRRPRPVTDAPIDALLVRVEDLAKAWLVALLEQEPLDHAPAILATELARDGPRVCDAVVRALSSDADLRRVEPGGALEWLVSQTGELAGARTAEAASGAVDALQAVIWSALRDELPARDPQQVLEIGERLSLITKLVRGAVLRQSDAAGEAREGEPPPGTSATGRLRVAPSGPTASPTPPMRPMESWEPPEDAPEPSEEPTNPPPDRPTPTSLESDPLTDLADAVEEATSGRRVRNALWIGALEDEITRAERAGAALSLLLVELEEADRMRDVEPLSEVNATFGRFAQAVRGSMRRRDILACETDTRAWIVARDAGRAGAWALGSRISNAVRSAESWRGAPMTVSVGVAVLGEDGRDCPTLLDAAEEAKFAAAASGLGIVSTMPEEDL
jgi:GGDEF domain-containing protein